MLMPANFVSTAPSATIMSEPLVLVSQPQNGIQIITFNRPKAGNALAMAMYHAVTKALKEAATNDAVKAVVITGKGKYFSTGADVAEASKNAMSGAGEESLIQGLKDGPVALTQAMIEFPKFVIAAVNGPVVGYPAGLLGTFDLVLVSENASFQVPFFHLGICPEGASSLGIARDIGVKRYTEWLLSNRVVKAKEMLESGLACGKLYPAENFIDNVIADLTRGVKATPMSSVLVSKKLLRAPDLEEYRKTNPREFEALAAQFREGTVIKRFAAVMMGLEKKKSKM